MTEERDFGFWDLLIEDLSRKTNRFAGPTLYFLLTKWYITEDQENTCNISNAKLASSESLLVRINQNRKVRSCGLSAVRLSDYFFPFLQSFKLKRRKLVKMWRVWFLDLIGLFFSLRVTKGILHYTHLQLTVDYDIARISSWTAFDCFYAPFLSHCFLVFERCNWR